MNVGSNILDGIIKEQQERRDHKRLQDKETVTAMLEAEQIAKDPSVEGYADLEEMFAEVKK